MKIPSIGRWLFAGILCLVGVMALPGCSGNGGGRETLTFWAMGREGDAVRRLIPAFEREHPAIRVDVQTLPWTGAHQKLLTAFAGGSTPDLCQLGNTWIAEFALVGALAPLEAMVEASSVVKPNDYFPGIWDTNLIGKTLYAVPWYVDTRLLFYRKDLLARAGFTHPPQTWAQWAHQLAAIKKMVGPGRYAVLLPLNEFEPLVALGLQQSEPLLRDGGRYGNFESPGFKKALGFYADIFRNRWAPKITDAEISNEVKEFAEGYFTFFVSGPWMIAELEAHMPKALRNTWATAPLPGPDGPGASIAGGASLVIFRASRHKRAAWQLIEFLSRPAVQRRFYRMVGDLPPRRTSWGRRAAAAKFARPKSATASGGRRAAAAKFAKPGSATASGGGGAISSTVSATPSRIARPPAKPAGRSGLANPSPATRRPAKPAGWSGRANQSPATRRQACGPTAPPLGIDSQALRSSGEAGVGRWAAQPGGGGVFADNPHVSAFRKQLELARPTPKVPEWEHIATQIALVGERLAHGELSVDQAARTLDRRADAILAKRRWVLDRK